MVEAFLISDYLGECILCRGLLSTSQCQSASNKAANIRMTHLLTKICSSSRTYNKLGNLSRTIKALSKTETTTEKLTLGSTYRSNFGDLT